MKKINNKLFSQVFDDIRLNLFNSISINLRILLDGNLIDRFYYEFRLELDKIITVIW